MNVFYVISWSVVSALVALWSLVVWGLHSFAVWSTSHVGALAAPSVVVGAMAVPDGLRSWIPPEMIQALESVLSALAPAVQSALSIAPSLAGGLSVAAWVLWALGSVVIVALGAMLHALVAMWRRRGSKHVRPLAGPAAAN